MPRMVTHSCPAGPRSRTCDAPGCSNESLPERRLVLRPAVGPVMDVPLHLCFCAEHGDAATLFERYREWQRSGAGAHAPEASAGRR
jgi:hypothetical protein